MIFQRELIIYNFMFKKMVDVVVRLMRINLRPSRMPAERDAGLIQFEWAHPS